MLQDESGQVIEERQGPAAGPGILEQAKGFIGLSPRRSDTTGAAEGPSAESRAPLATQVREPYRSSWAIVVCVRDTAWVLQGMPLQWALSGSS